MRKGVRFVIVRSIAKDMAEVLFYHLERATVEQVLPGLLDRTLARGWRAVVKAGTEEAAEAVDAHLWTYTDDSFLPHGRSDAEQQPIFVMAEGDIPKGFDVLFLVAGGAVPAQHFADYARTVVMFGEAEAGPARELWKAVKAEGYDATYWRQSPAGKWEKAA